MKTLLTILIFTFPNFSYGAATEVAGTTMALSLEERLQRVCNLLKEKKDLTRGRKRLLEEAKMLRDSGVPEQQELARQLLDQTPLDKIDVLIELSDLNLENHEKRLAALKSFLKNYNKGVSITPIKLYEDLLLELVTSFFTILTITEKEKPEGALYYPVTHSPIASLQYVLDQAVGTSYSQTATESVLNLEFLCSVMGIYHECMPQEHRRVVISRFPIIRSDRVVRTLELSPDDFFRVNPVLQKFWEGECDTLCYEELVFGDPKLRGCTIPTTPLFIRIRAEGVRALEAAGGDTLAERLEAWETLVARTAHDSFRPTPQKGRKKQGKGRRRAAPAKLPKELSDEGFLRERPRSIDAERARAFLMGEVPNFREVEEVEPDSASSSAAAPARAVHIQPAPSSFAPNVRSDEQRARDEQILREQLERNRILSEFRAQRRGETAASSSSSSAADDGDDGEDASSSAASASPSSSSSSSAGPARPSIVDASTGVKAFARTILSPGGSVRYREILSGLRAIADDQSDIGSTMRPSSGSRWTFRHPRIRGTFTPHIHGSISSDARSVYGEILRAIYDCSAWE